MGRLNDFTLEHLHELREQTEGEIPRERVLAAIGRKQGDEISTLAERHGVVEKTIRNWLDRFDARIDGSLYGQRALSETVFSTIKRTLGHAVRARAWYREFCEIVLMYAVYNIKRAVKQ